MTRLVFTIGHSTHLLSHFIDLLEKHRITAVADVRSSPYSRMNPQFNREHLSESLGCHRIQYVFLGRELGARSDDPACYDDDQVQYDRLAETELFHSGIERVQRGASSHQIALACAEKDPIQCHRTILVSKHLIESGLEVQHIMADGSLESHAAAMRRLMESLRMAPGDLFKSDEALMAEAYDRQAHRIAYRRRVEGGAYDRDVAERADE